MAVNIYMLIAINVSYFIGTVMVCHARRPSSAPVSEAVNNCVSAAFCALCSDVLAPFARRPDVLAPFVRRTREQRGPAGAYADFRRTDASNLFPSGDRRLFHTDSSTNACGFARAYADSRLTNASNFFPGSDRRLSITDGFADACGFA